MTLSRISSFFRVSPGFFGVVTVLAAVLFYYSFGAHKPLLLAGMDNRIADAMFHWRGRVATSGQVVIVDIDDASLARLGQWPWPRNIIARLVSRIHGAGARVVGIDSVFAEPDRSAPRVSLQTLMPLLRDPGAISELERLQKDEGLDYDMVLGRAVAGGPTVLSYVFNMVADNGNARPFPGALIRLDSSGSRFDELALIRGRGVLLNIDSVATAETEGFINVFPDPSGTVRRVPLLMEMDSVPYPSMAVEVARLGLGEEGITVHVSEQKFGEEKGLRGISVGTHFIPTDDHGQMTVNFRGPMGSFPYLSAAEVLEGIHDAAIKDRIVLIGFSAASLFDLRATPFSSIFPGVEVHATIIDNILEGDAFRHDLLTEIGLTYSLVVGGGLLLTLVLVTAGPLTGALAGGVLLALTVLGNYYFFFLRQELVGVTYPLGAMVLVFMVVTLANYISEGRAKSFVQGALGRYVSPQVVEQLLRSPEKLSLAGELKVLTIFFSDIRGFTTISEAMTPDQLAQFMNQYLTAMSDIIMEYKGTLDKFIGDAVMAIWGAPLDDEEHATHAVRAAFKMQDQLKVLRQEWATRNLPVLEIGIGINSGQVSVGNFGSKSRFDYTVMGDNVNLASRLESANKVYGTGIIISEFTRKAIGQRFFCRYLDKVRVKGKEEAVSIYEPLVEGEPDQALREEVTLFEQAVDAYQARRFVEALEMITALRTKNPLRLYSLYIYRINGFLENPPPADWDGVERRSQFPADLDTKPPGV